MLASLKRRLLRTSHPAPAGGGALPPPPPPQPTPPQPPPPPQPSPRHHVDLRGQLAALHLQFAALPPPRANQHSAEVLQALEALKARFPPADGDAVARPPPPLAAPLPPPRKRAARSPQRRMNRSATLPAARPAAGRRPAWRDPTVEREAGGAGESSEPAEAPPQPVAAAAPAETSGAGPSAAARPKLAALKRRQSRPSDAHPGPSPAAPLLPGDGEANGHWTAEARRTASGGGAELSAALTSMPARPRCYLASRITPRVLAAAAERAPAPASSLPPSGDPLAPESGRPDTGLWRRTISSGGGSRRGSLTGGDSDLWAGLAPAVSRATTPAAQGGASPLVPAAGCSRRGISQPELEWRGQGQQARPATREGGAQAEAAAAGGGQAGRLQAAAASASPSGTVQLQRLPRHELPADLLSLQESASLARQSQVGHPPRPPPRRVQRKAASAQEEPVAEAPAVAAVAAADPGAAPGTRAAQRVAALRGQRRGGWQSDFPAAVPSWRFSQEEEPSGALPPLAAQPPAGHSPAAAATAAAQTTQRASPHPAQLPPAPSPGLTHAQRRQQEAWGSLADMSLEQVLKQRGRAIEVPEAGCDSENSASNSSAPASPAALGGASPKRADSLPPAPQQLLPAPASQPSQPQHSPDTGGGGARQARRRTVPPLAFVESLERMAALQRARSDSEQQEGGILWRQAPALRGGRALQQGASASPGRLPPLQRSAAAELHELRLLCPGSRLASLRAEAEAAGLDQQLERAAMAGRPQVQRSQSVSRPAQAGAEPRQAPTAAVQPSAPQQPAPQWQQHQQQHWQGSGQPPAARPPAATAAPQQWWQPGQQWYAPHGYTPQQHAEQAAWQAAQQAVQQQQGARTRRKWIEAPAAQQPLAQPQPYSWGGYWPDQAAAQQAAAAAYWAGQYAGATGWPHSQAAAPGGMLPPLRGSYAG